MEYVYVCKTTHQRVQVTDPQSHNEFGHHLLPVVMIQASITSCIIGEAHVTLSLNSGLVTCDSCCRDCACWFYSNVFTGFPQKRISLWMHNRQEKLSRMKLCIYLNKGIYFSKKKSQNKLENKTVVWSRYSSTAILLDRYEEFKQPENTEAIIVTTSKWKHFSFYNVGNSLKIKTKWKTLWILLLLLISLFYNTNSH